MKILIIGSGGREHALANAYSKSKKVKKILVAPGNDFMSFQNKKIQTFPNTSSTDFEGILNIVKQHRIEFVDVAQDDPLALGFVDKLEEKGIKTFGPTRKAAEIEWSKDWARNFMQKYKFPIPFFKSFDNEKKAIAYVKSLPGQILYVKASGLALGKGALRAENKDQAIAAILAMKQFNNAGKIFLIEECLIGEEFSLFVICDGESYQIISAAQDHKTIYNCNLGPNTGGMGCVSPIKLLTPSLIFNIEQVILKPFMKGMQKEGRPYKGILYLGGIMTLKGIKIIEFNARWGDPEAEVIIPGIKNDYLNLALSAIKQCNYEAIIVDHKTRISVAGCATGYPTDYSNVKGKKIYGLKEVIKLPHIQVFGAGIKKEGKSFIVNGGRVFHIVAEGKDIREARRRAYEAMSMIYIEGNNLHYRTDIGWKDIYDNKN